MPISVSARRASHALECSICGSPRLFGATWFLITESSTASTLAIWKWSDDLSAQGGVKAVCGQRHARELIVHWITTGSLQYPFAALPALPCEWRYCDVPPAPQELTCLGELAIDRNEIIRVLNENPLSLNSMLDELMIVLEEQSSGSEETDFDEPTPILN